MISAKADALLGGGHYADGSTLARQLHDQKAGLKWVTLLVAPDSPKFAELGDAAVGISVPSQWEPQVSYKPDFGPTAPEFNKRFTDKYKIEAGYHAAGGYTAGLLLQHAIEESGSIDQAKVAARPQQDGRHHHVRPHQVLERSERARPAARTCDGARPMAKEGRPAGQGSDLAKAAKTADALY